MLFNLFGKGKEKEIEEYAKILADAVIKDEMDGDLMEELIDFSHDRDLSNKQLARAQAKACDIVFEAFYRDGIMTDEDYEQYAHLIEMCYMLKDAEKYRYTTIAKRCNALYKITEKGLLPTIRREYAAVDYREGENLHFASAAVLMEPEGTPESGKGIRIEKGTPFLIGAEGKAGKDWKEKEKGAFFITTFRAGFRSKKEAVTLELADLDFAEIQENVLCFFLKNGTVCAVKLDDRELAGAVLSNILNRDFEE